MRVDCGKKEMIIVKSMIVFLEMSWVENYRYYLMYNPFSIVDEQDYHVLLNENSEEEETSENERDSLFNSFTDDMDEMLENIKQKERFSSECM